MGNPAAVSSCLVRKMSVGRTFLCFLAVEVPVCDDAKGLADGDGCDTNDGLESCKPEHLKAN